MKITWYQRLSLGLLAMVLSLFSFCFPGSQELALPAETVIKDSALIEQLLLKYPDKFKKITDHPDKYELQIIYTQINRDSLNNPVFTPYYYRTDSKKYFYPASLVKLPCSALALEKLNDLAIPGLDKTTCMQTDSAFECQKSIKVDTSSENKKPSVANYIKKMLLVSDNDAYSRIYEFLGQEFINRRLKEMGYANARIVHRFDAECNTVANACTNPVSFYDQAGSCIYHQPMCVNSNRCEPPNGVVRKGKGYVDVKGRMVKQPKEYTYANHLSLEDITMMLRSLLFPEAVPKEKRFHLTADDHRFLRNYLAMYPRESNYPRYREKEYEDSYKKYFLYGTWHKTISSDSIRIFNIVGQSYGYLIDCAYVVNDERKIEFMLSAVIYVNEDGIINDGKYEYKETGFPFLTNLSLLFYGYEFQRFKKYSPDLQIFKIK